MKEIVFIVRAEEDEGFSATWDAPWGGGIATQGDDLAELQMMVSDAIEAFFEVAEQEKPERFRLHFLEDPSLVCT